MTIFNIWIDPVAFHFGNTEVRWYAICILTGVLLALWQGIKVGRKIGIFSDFIYLGILICLPVAILGARLWYVLFNLSDFDSIGAAIGINGGFAGLAIQGGVIASLIFLYFYSKKRKVSLYRVFEIVAPGFLIGQILGRWGNFCNHELYGQAIKNVDLFTTILPSFITDNMYIKGAYLLPGLKEGYYHPMFLYESMLNLLGLIVLIFVRKKATKIYQSGDAMGFYLVWYGIVRCITESFRHEGEVLMAGPIRVSILISIIFIIGGLALLILKRFIGPKENYNDVLIEIKENHIDTIIFDLDGTLIDTRQLVIRSYVHTFEKYFQGYILTDEELESFFGPALEVTFRKYETNEEKIKEMIAYYREFNLSHHDEFVSAFRGVNDTLRILTKKGYNIAIVSSKKYDVIKYGLEHTKLDQYFKVIIASEDVKTHKPNPEGIKKALEYFPDYKNALYVGDTPDDIKAGKNANVKTCGVLYSSKVEEVINENPDYLIKNLNDIIKIVCE